MRSSAILRSCVLVLHHHRPSKSSSNSQEHRYRGRMKVAGCVLDIECRLERIEPLELPEDTTMNFKLALVCFIPACFDFISTSQNIENHEKGQYFCHSFQKVKSIYYIDSLHIEWNISSLYFLEFWWLWLTDNENPKFSVSENWNIT